MKTNLTAMILLGGLLVLFPACQKGNWVSFPFGGEVGLLDDPNNLLGGVLSVGDPVSGVFRYDLDTLDSDPSLYRGLYLHREPPAGISAEIEGLVFRTDPEDVEFQVDVDCFLGHPADLLILSSWRNIIPVLEPGIVEGSLLQISLSDRTHGALESDALPVEINLDDWTSAGGAILLDAGASGDVLVLFSIDTIQSCSSDGLCAGAATSDGIDSDGK